jgi:serine/threonine protein phosphatase PrpC
VDNNQGIIDIVNEDFKKQKTHQKIVEDLLDKLLATETSSGLGCDNMTVVLIVFNN